MKKLILSGAILLSVCNMSCSHVEYSLDSEGDDKSSDSKDIRTAHFAVQSISNLEFLSLRDSDLGNAQEYCLKKLKVDKGKSIAIWAVYASQIERAESTSTVSFKCDIGYFDNQSVLNNSIYTKLEDSLDYHPFESAHSTDSKLITKVRRLPVSPFIKISIENIEPGQPIRYGHIRGVVKFVTRGNPVVLKGSDLSPDLIQMFLTVPDENEFKTENASLFVSWKVGGKYFRGNRSSPPTLELAILADTNGKKTERISLGRVTQLTGTQSFLSFPKRFKWAVATSAHQIEGGNKNNDWYKFEQKPGNIFRDDKSGDGPDHWNRIQKDISLLKKLGVNQYRMSIEWSRLEPKEGQWDPEATLHYKREIQLLRENGIEPVITLWHSTLPIWVSQKQGWEWDGIPQSFETFSLYVLNRIAPDVKYWITLNEPLLYLMGAYMRGSVPPCKKGSFGDLEKPLVQMLRAHARVYREFHKFRGIQVGIAHRMDMFTPYQSGAILDRWVSSNAQNVFNWTIPNAIQTGILDISIPFLAHIHTAIPELKDTQDFFGMNYYTRYALSTQLFPFDIKERPIQGTLEVTDMGWEIYPEGLYLLLSEVNQKFSKLPILITESGIADSSDRLREKYIRRHLIYLHHAIQKKIPVLNYSYWSLYDNFEWDQGYSIHVGLFETNYKTKLRVPRKSALFFEQVVKHNGIQL